MRMDLKEQRFLLEGRQTDKEAKRMIAVINNLCFVNKKVEP
ncbi:hypothetical protein [Borreliella turdi]|nr:hypothetical protein [Borreliella turdi]